jgi:hypothetical protein
MGWVASMEDSWPGGPASPNQHAQHNLQTHQHDKHWPPHCAARSQAHPVLHATTVGLLLEHPAVAVLARVATVPQLPQLTGSEVVLISQPSVT